VHALICRTGGRIFYFIAVAFPAGTFSRASLCAMRVHVKNGKKSDFRRAGTGLAAVSFHRASCAVLFVHQ
jgi:hypothetical protein